MAVTAEGVKTATQAVLLRAAGCKCLQGCHFRRPPPVAARAERLTKQASALQA